MKAYKGSGGTAPLILNLGARLRWAASFTPWPLHLWKRTPQHPLNRRLVGPQGWSEYFGEDKTLLVPLGCSPACSHYSGYAILAALNDRIISEQLIRKDIKASNKCLIRTLSYLLGGARKTKESLVMINEVPHWDSNLALKE
jgi:hypothetical protein